MHHLGSRETVFHSQIDACFCQFIYLVIVPNGRQEEFHIQMGRHF